MPDIVITSDELKNPHVDEVVNLEKSLTRSDAKFVDDVPTPLYLNPIFYYAVASSLAALVVWLSLEPFFDDGARGLAIPFVSDYLLFGPVAGGLGLAAGAVYGIANRNFGQAATCGIIGLGVGLGATVVTTVVADILFGMTSGLAVSIQGGLDMVPEGEFPLRGIAFFLFACGRGLAWCVVSMGAGLGLGVALKSKKLTLNGLAGGMVGGLLGGLLFDPVSRFLSSNVGDGALSRGIGIVAVGALVGLFVGLFENISKDAWFVMLQGPLAGKQFVIFKSPMILGSAPKCDVYLFKDPAIDPKHATVAKSGSRYLLSDGGSPNGTSVNGRQVDKHILQPGDVIALGDTVLRYQERVRG
ncbi:MAG: FHA domain-containing protein [Victivallales bacterium]|nr:FHA domain-containing protein [Victivallales bacterium]MBT7162319.1 FHA domain-containing protein [Victivallales bacterium]